MSDCPVFRPDHNGECLNCDEWLDEHTPAAIAAGEAASRPRRFWLSFCDRDRPEGDQFLGVCIVEVTFEDAAAMVPQLERQFPNRQPGSEWIAAATAKAWRLKCNPGGTVATMDITDHPAPEGVEVPLNTLMDRATLKRLGLAE